MALKTPAPSRITGSGFFSVFVALLLAALAFALFFYRIGDRALWSSDEGRYAEIPREMIESGDLVSPHLNYVAYFEKPPLVYWLTAVAFRVGGIGEGMARVWPALLGALGIVATMACAWRWFGPAAGLWAAWLLATSVGYFLVGRYLVLDMPFTVFLVLALFCLGEGFHGRKNAYLACGYVCIALATLIKGPVACVLSFAVMAVYLTWSRQWADWRKTGILWGVPLVVLLLLPWFVAVSVRNPTFPDFFFVHEHLERFATSSAGRPGRLYYFFGIAAAFFFPWSLFIPFLGEGLMRWRLPASPEDRRRAFLLVWVLVVFTFFTISKSKLPPYILPILPPLAILTAHWLCRLRNRQDGRFARVLPAALGIALGALLAGAIALAVYLRVGDDPEIPWIEQHAWVAAGILIVGAAAAFWVARKHPRGAHGRVVWGLTLMLTYPVVVDAMESMDPIQSSKELSGIVRGLEIPPEETLAIYGGYEDFSDLAFYLRRRLVVVGTNVGELTYGMNRGGHSAWFLSVDAFREHCNREGEAGRNVYCIAEEDEYNELVDKGIESFVVLQHTPKAYLLIQRPAKER